MLLLLCVEQMFGVDVEIVCFGVGWCVLCFFVSKWWIGEFDWLFVMFVLIVLIDVDVCNVMIVIGFGFVLVVLLVFYW